MFGCVLCNKRSVSGAWPVLPGCVHTAISSLEELLF